MIVLADAIAGAVHVVEAAVGWARLALDTTGIVVIVIGALRAMMELPAAIRGRRRFTQVRLDLARYLSVALEFQLAADVIETALTPTWERLGQLAAIAAIRTLLNYFLGREMKEERAAVGDAVPREATVPPTAAGRSVR